MESRAVAWAAQTAHKVRLAHFREDTKTWSPDPVQPVLEGHSDWVRDVAWAPSVGVGRAYLASAGQDKTVYIWTQDTPTAPWSKVALEPTPAASATQGATASSGEGKFGDAVWRVSWSVSGNVLAVSSGKLRLLWLQITSCSLIRGFRRHQVMARCLFGKRTSRANSRKSLNSRHSRRQLCGNSRSECV